MVVVALGEPGTPVTCCADAGNALSDNAAEISITTVLTVRFILDFP
jgi:hypothetical protein